MAIYNSNSFDFQLPLFKADIQQVLDVYIKAICWPFLMLFNRATELLKNIF